MGLERRRRRALAITIVCSLLAAGCSGGAEGADSSTTAPTTTANSPDRARLSEAADAVDRFVEEQGLNGAGMVVVTKDAGVVFEHYAGEFSKDRISLVASASKMVTAGVLARLADDGRLDLDRPVAEQVDWGDANPTITPAQLISNSSGLVALMEEATYPPYICQYVAAGSLQECGRRIFTTPDDDSRIIPPDTRFKYGGGQWQVAGAVAESVSGKPWKQLIDEIYVRPCGLEHLGFNNHYTTLVGSDGPFSYPTAFNADPATLPPTDNPNMEGGMYASPADYAKLLVMHLRGGRCGDTQVLSEAAVERVHSDRIASAYQGTAGLNGLEGYGMGWWVSRDDAGYVEDAGAFGAVPYLELDDGYGVYLVIEKTSGLGRQLRDAVRPLIAQAFGG